MATPKNKRTFVENGIVRDQGYDAVQQPETEQPAMTVSAVLEKAITNEIVKFDKYEARISELKDKYSGLSINGIKDADGYENVRLAIADLRSIRVGTDKDRKTIKAPFIAAGKSVEEKAQWIISEIEKIENPLQSMKDSIDAEKDRIRQIKIAEENARFIKRTQQLTKLGANFVQDLSNGEANFVLEDVSFEAVNIKGADDDIYEKQILPLFEGIFRRNERERERQEETKMEDARKLKEQQDKLAEEQANLLKQVKEMEERQQAERRKQQEEVEKKMRARGSRLMALDMKYVFGIDKYLYDDVDIDSTTVATLNDDEWEALVKKFADLIGDKKEKKAKADKEAADERQRKAVEAALAADAEKKRLAEQQKKEELAEKSDKEKFKHFVIQLVQVEEPVLESKYWNRKMDRARELILEIGNL